MRARRLLEAVAAACLLGGRVAAQTTEDGWRQALPGWTYQFPRDHEAHLDFKTEWWYFTGNLRADHGRRYGFQVTFFRQGIRPPGEAAAGRSRFLVGDLKFAHFALTDVARQRFDFAQKISRGAFGEAGFGAAGGGQKDGLVWLDDWRLSYSAGTGFTLAAASSGAQLSLHLAEAGPWTIHGENGVSQKAAGAGHASHYYSGPRLPAQGRLVVAGHASEVQGEAWFDHEWASNQLTPEQVGWDWFSLQLDDGSELMLYQMRTRHGGADPQSSGTFIAADGTARHLRREDYLLRPAAYWQSPATKARYPIGWEVQIPSLQLQAHVSTPVSNQELVLQPIAYWEGLIDAQGTRAGHAVKGTGYLELTGYAGPLTGLAAPSP